MISFMQIYGVVLMIIAASLGVYFLFIKFRKIKEQPTNDPILYNQFMSHYTGGFSDLYIKEFVQGKYRIGLKLVPRDINPLNYYNIKKRKVILSEDLLKPFILWCPKDKLIPYVQGTVSREKNIYQLLPLSITQINPMIRDSPLGQFAIKLVSEKNETLLVENYLKRELEKSEGMILNDMIGNITPEALKKLDAEHMDSLKVVTKDKDLKSPSFLPQNPYRQV